MSSEFEVVKNVIRARRTEKVLASLEGRAPVPANVEAKYGPLVRAAVETAGWAPFHFPI